MELLPQRCTVTSNKIIMGVVRHICSPRNRFMFMTGFSAIKVMEDYLAMKLVKNSVVKYRFRKGNKVGHK